MAEYIDRAAAVKSVLRMRRPENSVAQKRFGQLYDDVKPFEVDKVVFDPFRRLPVVVTDY